MRIPFIKNLADVDHQDYYFTYYSAEIINTLTNAMFIWLAYEGVKSCKKNKHDTVFQVAYAGYFLV